MPLDVFLAQLKTDVERAANTGIRKPKTPSINEEAVRYYSDELEKNHDDEAKFLSLLSELNSDNRVRKLELSKIAERFGDSSAKTVAKLLQSIKTRYYEKIYDRDANAMARRATPW